MSSILKIDTDLMKQKSGSISSFCEKHRFRRVDIYNLNGATRIHSERNKTIVNDLIDMGYAKWVHEEKAIV